MSDDKPSTSSNDAEAVIAALKDLGASNYAALAKATGLSKIAVSAAITELRKSGLVNSESGGKYSAAESNKTTPAAKESTGSKKQTDHGRQAQFPLSGYGCGWQFYLGPGHR